MPIFFCPQCWGEVAESTTRCAACGAGLSAVDAESYDEKLMRALHHPDAALRAIGTPDAAAILEVLKDDPSVIVREAARRRRLTTMKVAASRPEPVETH